MGLSCSPQKSQMSFGGFWLEASVKWVILTSKPSKSFSWCLRGQEKERSPCNCELAIFCYLVGPLSQEEE